MELGDSPGEIEANAKLNPGTLRIENALTGKTVWLPDSPVMNLFKAAVPSVVSSLIAPHNPTNLK